MNVCEALIDILAANGVQYVFGVPGDAINELIEAIRKQDKIKFIHVMHEEAGAFAASAQAKLSGRLAVCAGTAGPGAIHLLNGLYDAKMDHAPVLAITGQVETLYQGTAYQQEVNLDALYEDVSVYNQTIIDPGQMPRIATLACQAAISRKGVAHLSIPSNISSQKVKSYNQKMQEVPVMPLIVPHFSEIKRAADLINAAKKPCILAGIGARHAVNTLVNFAELIQAPIVKALRGKDILPDDHPLVLGGTGLLGTVPAVKAMGQCDVLIVAGSDFPYHEFYPDADIPTIQIDIEPQQIGRRNLVTVPLCGDVELTLNELSAQLIQKPESGFLHDHQKEMKDWRRQQDKKELSDENPIHPQRLARTVSDLASEDAVICCDTGAVTVWAARHFQIRGTQLFTLSGGLASMAFGLPAALGAQLLYPGRQVIALCGDGGFAMLMCDFATAVKYKLPVKVVIFNNAKLGLIQMEEEAMAGNPESETDLCNPDYAAFARSCGGEGYSVREPGRLQETLSQALASDRPCIVNVYVNPGEITWPPEVEADQAFNYVKAKIKEFFTGR